MIIVSFFLCFVAVYCCELYLGESEAFGVGVFAGKEWEGGDVLEVGIGVPVHLSAVYWSELMNYSEGYNGTHALLTLGNSMLYNHIPDPDQELVRKYMSRGNGFLEFRQPFGRSIDIDFVARRPTEIGEELLSHYGYDWFEDRGIGEVRKTSDEVISHDNTRLPGCAQDYVQLTQNQITAKQFIPAGAIIETARAVLIPEWAIVQDGPLVDLLWWNPATNALSLERNPLSGELLDSKLEYRKVIRSVLGSPYRVAPWDRSNTSYAVLLTGSGSLYSHCQEVSGTFTASADGELSMDSEPVTQVVREANVQYAWLESSTVTDNPLLRLVTFTAARDISAGEELVVPLMLDPVTHRRYVQPDFAAEYL